MHIYHFPTLLACTGAGWMCTKSDSLEYEATSTRLNIRYLDPDVARLVGLHQAERWLAGASPNVILFET